MTAPIVVPRPDQLTILVGGREVAVTVQEWIASSLAEGEPVEAGRGDGEFRGVFAGAMYYDGVLATVELLDDWGRPTGEKRGLAMGNWSRDWLWPTDRFVRWDDWYTGHGERAPWWSPSERAARLRQIRESS